MFVHLHNHTEYSLEKGALAHVSDMVKRALELGQPAVAITDVGVMSGVPELAGACESVTAEDGSKVKPIFGCELAVVMEQEISGSMRPVSYPIVLLAKDNAGYHNLVRLVSCAQIENFQLESCASLSMLAQYGQGLICLSGNHQGPLARMIYDGAYDLASRWAQDLAACFEPGDFYIELCNQGFTFENGTNQIQLNKELVSLASSLGLPVVATNDTYYVLQEHSYAQDIMSCIKHDQRIDDVNRIKLPNDQFFMKSADQMAEMFVGFEGALASTLEIADRCNVELERDSILPRFPLPEGETEESYFRKRCLEGLERRYGKDYPEEVAKRYEYEASVIIQQGFPAYFLIVQEYIEWAKSHGIGVGPGRGSAAGSIVAYALGITDIEPLKNGLLFERFLSVERVEMPDIDVDFEDERRGEVIEHVRQLYGEDHVSGVITFGKLQAKNAVRDAARVFGYDYSVGDKISKLIGDELGITLRQAMGTNPDLAQEYKQDERVKRVIDAAMSIEGYVRNEGVHACATIICRDPMSEHVPMKRDTKGDVIITQYDGHYTPDLGLLKMDFLGLRTLSVLSKAAQNIKERFGVVVVPDEIPLDDTKAFDLMCGEGSMDGLFQVESDLYVKLFARMKPRSFSDVVASIALNRPGPLENGFVDLYVDRRMGKSEISYYDDRLKPLLEETYGTIVYQEQIMQISMAMSGFSAGKADRLRKAMGKKKIDVMMKLKDDWCEGALANGYSLEVAQRIWSDAEEFAKYAFNKSHSAAYAVLVMRTAYMKAYYPFDFMAAVLSSYMGTADRLKHYISSCNRSNIPVLPPDINSSNLDFTPTDDGIRFGLAGVRGVGLAVAEEIIAERRRGGTFSSLHDFVARVNHKFYNRKTLEHLIKVGAFDSTGYTRRQCMYFLNETALLESASQRQKDKAIGQSSIFDLIEDPAEEVPEPDGIEWDKKELLKKEKEILKMFVSDHPLRPYEEKIAEMSKWRISSLITQEKNIPKTSVVGMIVGFQYNMTRKNKKMVKVKIEDTSGQIDCVFFDAEKTQGCLEEDAIVHISGKFERSDFGPQLIGYEIERLEFEDKPAQEQLRCLELNLLAAAFKKEEIFALQRILGTYFGRDSVVVNIHFANKARLSCELPFKINASSRALYEELYELFGGPIWEVKEQNNV